MKLVLGSKVKPSHYPLMEKGQMVDLDVPRILIWNLNDIKVTTLITSAHKPPRFARQTQPSLCSNVHAQYSKMCLCYTEGFLNLCLKFK